MTEIDRIIDQLDRALKGPAWSGPSMLEVLEGVDSKIAARKPLENVHTIWEIVLHIIKWEEVAIERLKGRDIRPTPEEDWKKPEDLSEKTWQDVIERLKQVHNELSTEISNLHAEKLDEPQLPGFLSKYILLHGVIQHNLYHIGQVAIIKKA
jgi:uncharacterized damage-inducible protein DinB